MTARVSWISLTPVKALALDLVEETELLESGLSGDRLFFLIDENDRLVNAKGHGPLQTVRAAYDDDARMLTLRFADGAVLSGTIEPGAAVVTSFHRTPKPGRLVPGPWDEALSSIAGLAVRLVEPDLPAPDRDRVGAATLLGAGSLAALAAALGVDVVDPRRFRMNFGVEGPEAHAEDAWLGRRVRIAAGRAAVPRTCWATRSSSRNGSVRINMFMNSFLEGQGHLFYNDVSAKVSHPDCARLLRSRAQ